MIDFDNIDDWAPLLAFALREHVPVSIYPELIAATPQYIEDARALLFELTDKEAVLDATLTWLRGNTLSGYHGSRLTDDEVNLIRTNGLIPLKAESRCNRITRALSPHPRWGETSKNLDKEIEHHGKGNSAGQRENQVHLTLSKSGLLEGFNHYLTYGSEFDQHVAYALLGQEGVELLAQDGKAVLINVAVPGTIALDKAHPYFTIDDIRAQGELPNIASEFLEAWSYRLAHPTFQSKTLGVDCGMVFQSPSRFGICF